MNQGFVALLGNCFTTPKGSITSEYGPGDDENNENLLSLASENNVVVFGLVKTRRALYAVPAGSEVYLEYYQNPGVFSLWNNPEKKVQMALVPRVRVVNPDSPITPLELHRERTRIDIEEEAAGYMGAEENIMLCQILKRRLVHGLSQGPSEFS